MPQVRVTKTLVDVQLDDLWRIAVDLGSYPKFIDSVVSVDVLEQADVTQAVSSWVVLFNGNELRWIENNRFDRDLLSLGFEQIEGDLAIWGGTLTLKPTGRDIVATYLVRFDLGIPSLGHLLHPLGEAAIRQSCEQMLDSLGARARFTYHA